MIVVGFVVGYVTCGLIWIGTRHMLVRRDRVRRRTLDDALDTIVALRKQLAAFERGFAPAPSPETVVIETKGGR